MRAKNPDPGARRGAAYALALSFAALLVLALTAGPAAAQSVDLRPADGDGGESPLPHLVLYGDDEGFFVLASEVPVEVAPVGEEASGWLTVEAVEEESMPHRIVKVTSKAGDLAPGTYSDSVSIRFHAPDATENRGSVLFPVVLVVEDEPSEAARLMLRRDPELVAGLDRQLLVRAAETPGLKVSTLPTPGGHFIIEITERRQYEAPPALSPRNVLSERLGSYQVVFPWMCQEYCTYGRTASTEMLDVRPNKDAITDVSYERYSMSSGGWYTLSVSDPTSLIAAEGLGTWPMLIGGSSYSSVVGMYNNRVSIGNQMVNAAQANGYAGYCIDVEGYDSSGSKTYFIALVDYLADRMHAVGKKLMVAQATWASLAPMSDLAGTSVDYVASMDLYTNSVYYYQLYVTNNYSQIAHNRLIWAFAWEHHNSSSQAAQWQWMNDPNGDGNTADSYNNGVAGAAVWRTPAASTNGIDYYAGFRTYYPVGPAPNAAEVVVSGSSFPSTLAPGQTATVTVRVKNTGTNTWWYGSAYRLGTQGDNTVSWSGFGSCGGYRNATNDARAFLCYTVYPGQTHDFTFNITAPASGTAVLSVDMVLDGVEWFEDGYSKTIGGRAALKIINGASASGIYEGLWVTHCLGDGTQLVWQVDSTRERAPFLYVEPAYDCGTAGSFGIYPLAFRSSTVQSGTWITWCTGNGSDELVWQSNGSWVHAPFQWPQSDIDGECPDGP